MLKGDDGATRGEKADRTRNNNNINNRNNNNSNVAAAVAAIDCDANVRAAFQRRIAPAELPPPFTSNYAPYSQNQLRDVLFTNHAKHWDIFYRNNGVNAYKDRHYILREFTQLADALSAVCGVEAAAPSSLLLGSGRRVDRRTSPARRQREAVVTAEADETPLTATDAAPSVALAPATNTTRSGPCALLLDLGCGVGNLCLPLLDEYPRHLAVVALDLSLIAVQRLRATLRERGQSRQVTAAQCDLGARADTPTGLAPVVAQCAMGLETLLRNNVVVADGPVFASLVFVLCSVPVGLWGDVVDNVAASLRVAEAAVAADSASSAAATHHGGGSADGDDRRHDTTSRHRSLLFFRDYCANDLAMHRFRSHRAVVGTSAPSSSASVSAAAAAAGGPDGIECRDDDGDDAVAAAGGRTATTAAATATTTTFMRTNGTLSHFFTVDEVRALFAPRFDVIELRVVTIDAPKHDVLSVDGQITERRFVQGIFALR